MQIYSQCTHEPIAISINCVKWTFVLLTFSDNFGKFIRSPLMSSRDFKIRNNSTKYILHRISCEFVAYCVLGFVHLRQSNVYMHRLNDTLATSQPLSLVLSPLILVSRNRTSLLWLLQNNATVSKILRNIKQTIMDAGFPSH